MVKRIISSTELTIGLYEEELGLYAILIGMQMELLLAYVRFDESKVKEINIPIYYHNLYPEELRYKYPKADKTLEVSLHVFDTKIMQQQMLI